MRGWIARLAAILRPARSDADLELELQAHLELAGEAAQRSGLDARDERQVCVAAGGRAQAMEALRDQRGGRWLEDLRRDTAYAMGALARAPIFAVTAVLALAIGIGANTTIFSLIDAVILRPLPVERPNQLVILTDPAVGGAAGGLVLGERDHVTYGEFQTLRDGMSTLSGMLAVQAWTTTQPASIDGGPGEDVRTKLVSNEFFSLLGIHAVAGRTFDRRDDHGPGNAPVAVISHAFWERRFGSALTAVNARVRIADADLTIVGVAPPAFLGETVGEAPDLWIPLAMQPSLMPGSNWLGQSRIMWLHAIGRLADGETLASAQAQASSLFAGILQEISRLVNPRIAGDVLQQNLLLRDVSRGVSPLRGNYSLPLYILMGLVALVLVVACTSVGVLLLARATARQKEFDVRLAVGAGTRRLFSQLLTESFVLTALAGILGAVLSSAGVRLLVATVLGGDGPGQQAATLEELGVRPDLRVLGFTAVICLLTVMAFGLVPAWSASRTAARRPVRGAALRRVVPRMRLGHALVSWQVAASLVLLIGAGWFLRTFRNLDTFDLGYTRQIAQATVDFRGVNAERRAIEYESVRKRLATLSGVRAVTYSQTGLLGDNYIPIRIEGFQGRDDGSSPLVCVVNEAFATFFFGEADPVGRDVIQGDTRFRIVGVSRNATDTLTYPRSFADNLRGGTARAFYPALLQFKDFERNPQVLTYQLRTEADPGIITGLVTSALRDFTPAISLTRIRTIDEEVRSLIRQQLNVAQLSLSVSVAALLLACVGLFGLLAHVVTRRTNEIGIRMALGARPPEVVWMVLREMSVLVAIGCAIGVPVSLAAARLVQSQLFGLEPADLPTLLVSLVVTVSVGALAAFFPARRAARIDPLLAIRTE